MPLLSIWKDSPDKIREFALHQIVSMAGTGALLDGSSCSNEFRSFLSEVEAEDLERFVSECLEPGIGRNARKGFDNSGLVLQDVVNEIGRRLDFSVTNGVYQGRKGVTGFDGIWQDGSATDLVIEVKTTDTYTISLDHIERYRRELTDAGRITEGSSVLFIVGREDTGALEAQIRGSKHAWTMRMIGAASLVRLLQVKVNSESGDVVDRIRSLLRPIEYTRIDGIVDLMFDVRADVEPAPGSESDSGDQLPILAGEVIASRPPSSQPVAGIESFRQAAADAVSDMLNVRLTRRRRSSFETADETIRAVIAVSKRYDRDYQSYWYGYYDTQRTYLSEANASYLVLCGLGPYRVWALPADFLEPLLKKMNTTRRADGQTYWHILTKLIDDDCMLVVNGEEWSLRPYEVSVRLPATGKEV